MATWALLYNNGRSVISTQATTEAAPAADTDGLNLDSVAGFTVHIACDNGFAFSDPTSTFIAYRYSPESGLWARAAENDITVGSAGNGQQTIAVSFQVASPRGRIAHIANNVSITGGTTPLTLRYLCNQLTGAYV